MSDLTPPAAPAQTVWREGDRIRCTDGRGYGDSVGDDEIRQHIEEARSNPKWQDALSLPFARAVLAIREFERASEVGRG